MLRNSNRKEKGISLALSGLFARASLIAQAKFIKDTGFQISPSGAGKIFFTKEAKTGLYINRKE
jgi:hypothetical protein